MSALAIRLPDVSQEPQIAAKDIPAPLGASRDKAEYNDIQVLQLLDLTHWPVTAPDTDIAHAYRLRDFADGDLAFVSQLGGWMYWDGRRWRGSQGGREGELHAQKITQRLNQQMYLEMKQLGLLENDLLSDTKRLEDARAMNRAKLRHLRAARSIEKQSRQKAVLEAARPLHLVSRERFEPRPWVIGFANGTWDHGVWREHRREDYMQALSPVTYDPSADRSVWQEVLDRITGSDTQLALTLQDIAGYVLSGASSLRILPWLYGPKGTGKSTFSELLGTLLGEMSAAIDTKQLAKDGSRDRLGAAIWGKRAVTCSEAGNARLDAELLKMLSGGDRLPVRFLYAEGFTAAPKHVLLMLANDAPQVAAYDDALKDRVLALPFEHPLNGGAPLLGGARIEAERLRPDSPLLLGFTSWAVEGLHRVQENNDVYRAPSVLKHTEAFWAEVDPLHEFWLDLDQTKLASGIGKTDLRKRYEAWCSSVGVRTLAMPSWRKACLAFGLEDRNIHGGHRVWRLRNLADLPGNSGNSTEANFHKPLFSPSRENVSERVIENRARTVTTVTASTSGDL